MNAISLNWQIHRKQLNQTLNSVMNLGHKDTEIGKNHTLGYLIIMSCYLLIMKILGLRVLYLTFQLQYLR